MSAASNAQAVIGLLTEPTCPHCRKSIASGELLASHAQELWKAIVAALAASDLPAEVPRADGLDLGGELGAAYWTLDGNTYRFVPIEHPAKGMRWRVYFQRGVGGLEWHAIECPSDFDGAVRHGEAAIGVIHHAIHGRLLGRFWGRGESHNSPIIAGSGTYAP